MTGPEDLSQLGGKTVLPASPDEAVLEKVANPRARATTPSR